MSNTTRRKDGSYDKADSSQSAVKYHSDAGIGSRWMTTAPRWYRRSMNKKIWRDTDLQCHNFLKGCAEDVVGTVKLNNGSWYW